jgi:hypothetical protein
LTAGLFGQIIQTDLQFFGQFGLNQLICFLDKMGPFGVTKAIKVVNSDPFEFGSAVWCWSNAILFAKCFKNFVTHFETGFIQLLDVGGAKNFAHDHKTKLVAILDAFTGPGEREAEVAELFDVHGKGNWVE